jgi:hypothetical protein
MTIARFYRAVSVIKPELLSEFIDDIYFTHSLTEKEAKTNMLNIDVELMHEYTKRLK